jgi:hypothetical protein
MADKRWSWCRCECAETIAWFHQAFLAVFYVNGNFLNAGLTIIALPGSRLSAQEVLLPL